MNAARTMFEKVWDAHQVVAQDASHPAILYIDLHLIHEVTSPQAFTELRAHKLPMRRPERTVATLDHATPTLPPRPNGERPYVTAAAKAQVSRLEANCTQFGVTLHGWDSGTRGIVHVMGPELGLTQPGMTIVCGDSHTSTHGAFGALAFGIGTTEVGHVMASQCLLQSKPKTMAITVDGRLRPGVSAKDLILTIIGKVGIGGGTGHVFEYRGSAIEALTMEERMTLCNMSIEAGARAGMIAPDETTFAWLKGLANSPQGEAWDAAVARWRQLPGDPGAHFDAEVYIDGDTVRPTISYGTNPGMVMGFDETVPEGEGAPWRRMLDYMHIEPGQPMTGQPIDIVFVGSCTNGRLPDLRVVAQILKGRKVAPGVRMLISPGSESVAREAQAEGLHHIFVEAGAEWRLPGCSMCIAMNGDIGEPGNLVVSTSNRNFEGRQGKGVRTVLASPATAAASAIAGRIADPTPYLLETAA